MVNIGAAIPKIAELVQLIPLLSPIVGGAINAAAAIGKLWKEHNKEADDTQLRKNLSEALTWLQEIDARQKELEKE